MQGALKKFRPSGFVKHYLAYAARLTDAPAEFHLFTALTVLGAAAARVRIPYGSARLAPGLWTVLVAPSAFFRKTTALDLGRRLLAEARPAAAPPLVYHSNRLLHSVRGHTPASQEKFLAVDDFSWLLAPPVARRLVELDDAGTPLALEASVATPVLCARLSAVDFAAGFLCRFGFVLAGDKERWHALPGTPDAAAERELIEMLRRAARIEGEVSLRASRRGLNRWGRSMTAWMNGMGRKRGHFWMAAGLASRLETVVLKLAALIEISERVESAREESSRPVRVSAASFASARRLTFFLRWSFGRLLVHELRRANEFHQELGVLMRVRRSPGIARRRLQWNSHLDAATLRRVLDTLERDGRLSRNGHHFYPVATGAKTHLLAEKWANGHLAESA